MKTRRPPFDAEAHRAEIETLIDRGCGIMEIAAELEVGYRAGRDALAVLNLKASDRRQDPAVRAKVSAARKAAWSDPAVLSPAPPEHEKYYRKLCPIVGRKAARIEIDKLIKAEGDSSRIKQAAE